jgi:type IV fimbrial biogenesis protein FimT
MPSAVRFTIAQSTGRRKARGVTIIELLVVLTVLAVTVTLGAPSFVDFVRNMRLASVMSDLNADLLLARSESIRRNNRVLLCPRSTTTSTVCAAAVVAATWMNGWLVCYDADADGACDATSATDPNPIRVRNGPSAPLSLTGPAAVVTFFPIGSASGAATFTGTGGTSTTRTLTLAPSGSITSSKT